MRARYLFFTLAVLSCSLVMANPIDLKKARRKAETFQQQHGNSPARLDYIRYGQQKDDGGAPFYVFNQGDRQGFVIVAGDDGAGDILAYADRGRLDAEDMPQGIKDLLDCYANEISAIRKHQAAFQKPTYPDAERQPVAPLIETRWGQDKPYCTQCLTAAGKQAVAGWGATALAQVLYYYRAQVSCTGIPGYTTGKGDQYDGLDACDFTWRDMMRAYGENADDAAREAVARLFLYAGRAMKTAYGTTSSPSDITDIPDALTCFGFGDEAMAIDREQCGVEEWDRIIYQELKHGRPVIYAASNSLNNSHTFICDGYDGNGLFHINWGKEGEYDGYYRLQAVNLSSLSTYGFSLNHRAVVGISPSVADGNGDIQTGETPAGTAGDLDVVEIYQMDCDNRWKVVRAAFENRGASDYAGVVRLQLDGVYLSSEELYVAAGKTGFVDFTITKEPGTYALKVVEKKTGRTICQEDAFTLTDMKTASDEDITLVAYRMQALDDGKMAMYGNRLEALVTLRNGGEGEYHGIITLTPFVTNEELGTIFLIGVPKPVSINVSIPAGQTRTFSVISEDLSVGDTFYVTLEVPGRKISKADSYHPYTVVEGYHYWDESGICHAKGWEGTIIIPEEAAAVGMEKNDLSNVTVTPNGNPNTIYYLSDEKEIPASLSSCIVVCDGKATGDVILHDDYGCYVPMAFYVEGKAAYSHAFHEGINGLLGWHKIRLPFTIQHVSADGKGLEWCRNHDGKGYDFWLTEPSHVSGDTLHVVAADEWLAGMDYYMAVPGERYPSDFNLCGKSMTFEGSNVWMAKGHYPGASPCDSYYVRNDTAITGDVNNDGLVTITDVMLMVNAIIGAANTSLPLFMGDMDGNRQFTVSDVVGIINIVVGN